MNKKQLSEHIGNIDDRLVEQAEKIPNYRQLHHRKIIRRFITVAAAFVLMACSFSAGAFDDGVLFYIVCYDESMTPEQFAEKGYDFVQYRYLFSTSDKTYILCYPSDVQWNPENPEQEAEYLRMEAEIKDIKYPFIKKTITWRLK